MYQNTDVTSQTSGRPDFHNTIKLTVACHLSAIDLQSLKSMEFDILRRAPSMIF